MELEKDFVSIGQKLGFVSAGDERRAMEKKIRELEARNAELEAALAAKQN